MIELGNRTAFLMLVIYCFLMTMAALIWKRLSDIVFIIMLINCVIMYIKEKPFEFDQFIVLLLIFLLYSLLTIIWSANKSFAISTNFSILQRIGFAICVYGIVNNKNRVETILYSLLFSGVFILLYMLITNGPSGLINKLLSESKTRLGDDVTNANTVGGAFSIAAIVAWYFITRNQKNGINIVLFFVFFVFLLATGSRTSFFGLIVGVITSSFYSTKPGKLFRVVLALLGIAIFYIIIKNMGLMPKIIERFDEALAAIFGEAEFGGSAKSRLEFAEYGIGKIRENPIVGYGAGQFRHYMGTEKGLFYSSHNNYIEVLFSYGIIGGLIWYGMYLYCIVKLWKPHEHPENAAVIALLLMRMVSDIAGHSISTTGPYLYLALAFATLKYQKNSMASNIKENEGETYGRKSYIRANSPH